MNNDQLLAELDEPLPMAEAEYLAFEEQAEEKHEFVDGWVYSLHGVVGQAGASVRHNQIQMNVLDALRPVARRRGCQALGSDLRVRVPDSHYYYPDVVVTCDPLAPESTWTEKPVVLIEVTSQRTARNDRDSKLDAYRSMPSLRVYLIVSHREQRVDCYSRDGAGDWQHATYTQGDIWLEPLGFNLSVEAIYDSA